MTLYDVHYLERFADRFIALGLRRYGLTLEQYLNDPARVEQRLLEEPRPMLARQRAVQKRLEAEEATRRQREAEQQRGARLAVEAELEDFPRRNGRAIEPLHHSRRPKRSRKSDFTRRARHAG